MVAVVILLLEIWKTEVLVLNDHVTGKVMHGLLCNHWGLGECLKNV